MPRYESDSCEKGKIQDLLESDGYTEQFYHSQYALKVKYSSNTNHISNNFNPD